MRDDYVDFSRVNKVFPTLKGPLCVVKDFNLNIPQGQFVCLIGHSGCGKSTVLNLVGGLGAFLFVPGRRQGLSRWAMGLAGALYIGMPFNYYLLLYTSKPNGLTWTLFTILAVVASDAAALLIGSRIGRHPFFTNISPKKTVEGAVAGVVGSVIVMLIGVSAVLGYNPIHAIALGVLVGVSAEVGDLVESQMKRLAEVKDSSHLIPGHGGVLDRIDSILFPPILAFLYLMVFHLL